MKEGDKVRTIHHACLDKNQVGNSRTPEELKKCCKPYFEGGVICDIFEPNKIRKTTSYGVQVIKEGRKCHCWFKEKDLRELNKEDYGKM